jgi:hypothetical protein
MDSPLSDTAERGDPVGAWLSLPRRIYLDTSTLHKLYDSAGSFSRVSRSSRSAGRRVRGLAGGIDALRMILMINERAMFEFVVTEASLREVVDRAHPRYTQWVYDVLDTWLIQSEGDQPPAPGRTFDGRRFGMISVKDRQLLQEALDWRCDAFMTMERRFAYRGDVHRARDRPEGNAADDAL